MLALLLVSPHARRRIIIMLALLLTSAHASITPSYADVHGGTALTLTMPANALPPGEASPFCVIGTEWVVAVLHSARRQAGLRRSLYRASANVRK